MIPALSPQPEKEYIIIESCIVSAENNFFSFRERKKEWAAEVRSRPHTPTPSERDKIIDEIITGIEFEGLRSAEEIWRMIEELRTPSEAPR